MVLGATPTGSTELASAHILSQLILGGFFNLSLEEQSEFWSIFCKNSSIGLAKCSVKKENKSPWRVGTGAGLSPQNNVPKVPGDAVLLSFAVDINDVHLPEHLHAEPGLAPGSWGHGSV